MQELKETPQQIIDDESTTGTTTGDSNATATDIDSDMSESNSNPTLIIIISAVIAVVVLIAAVIAAMNVAVYIRRHNRKRKNGQNRSIVAQNIHQESTYPASVPNSAGGSPLNSYKIHEAHYSQRNPNDLVPGSGATSFW